MYVTELDSFVHKFHQMWKAGLTAHLDLDSHAGKAWVGIRLQLGHVPGPVHQQVHHPSSPPHRSPSYHRRQERRKAARSAADRGSQADKACEAPEATENAAETSDEFAETAGDAIAEKARTDFPCLICDFVSNWESGLQVHMSRKHTTIKQVDGNNSFVGDESEEDEKYDRSVHYWKTGYLGTGYQNFIDANEVIDASNLNEVSKNEEKEKILEARKCAFGDIFINMPPWNQRIQR